MKRVALAVWMAASLSLSSHAQVMGRLPGVLFPSDRGTRTSSNLQVQVTAVSTVPYTFILDRGVWSITEDLSFPATVKLQLLPGAVFEVATNVNLEILGELDAPEGEIFTGTGTASGPATFPYRHAAWGATDLFDIGTGYLASYADFTNEQAAVAAQISDVTNNLSAVGGVLIAATNDIAELNSNFSSLNEDVGVINTNFTAVSNDFTIVSGVVNTNASILATNAVAHNYNFTTVLPDLFDDVFAGVSGWDRAAFTNSLQRASTNASYVIPGSLGSYLSLTNWYYSSFENIIQPWATNVNQVWGGVNVGALNSNFTLIASDFVSVSNYLLNAANGVIPTLQSNQNITATNFQNVNVNTEATTNLFAIAGYLLGVLGEDEFGATIATEVSTNYNAWLESFRQMETGYAPLATNLSLLFPNLLAPIESAAYASEAEVEALRLWVDANYVSKAYLTGLLDSLGLLDAVAVDVFYYTGAADQVSTVPVGATNATIYAWGGSGGGGAWAGPGGAAWGTLAVVTNSPGAGEVLEGAELRVEVGSRGSQSSSRVGGGGTSSTSGAGNFGGGGRSSVYPSGAGGTTNEYIVAGGGGGAGFYYNGATVAAYDLAAVRARAGKGGGASGQAGATDYFQPCGSYSETPGRRNSGESSSGGGGGGGYYGGGAGYATGGYRGAGAGGSGYVGGMATGETSQSTSTASYGTRVPAYGDFAYYEGSAGVSGSTAGVHGLVVIVYGIVVDI